MAAQVPLRWPAAWDRARQSALLDGSPFNCVLSPGEAVPAGVMRLEGTWPGAKASTAGDASAGPTGVPWVDTNLPAITLEQARAPQTPIWVDAAPAEPRLSAGAYVTGAADCGAWGATWIASLDSGLAGGIESGNAAATRIWEQLKRAAAFFASRADWSTWRAEAVIGIVSDFEAANEFFARELLNLTSRAGQQCSAVPAKAASFGGVKAVVYADAIAPPRDLRARLTAFAQSGGLVVAGPSWGNVLPIAAEPHPRFRVRPLGRGRIAVSNGVMEDPYLVANDAVTLASHRHDLLRFWNGGAYNARKTISPDRKRTLVQIVFYSGARGGDPTVWIAGRYRAATLSTIESPAAQPVELHAVNGGVEVHLPAAGAYAAVELENA